MWHNAKWTDELHNCVIDCCWLSLFTSVFLAACPLILCFKSQPNIPGCWIATKSYILNKSACKKKKSFFFFLPRVKFTLQNYTGPRPRTRSSVFQLPSITFLVLWNVKFSLLLTFNYLLNQKCMSCHGTFMYSDNIHVLHIVMGYVIYDLAKPSSKWLWIYL